MKTFDLSGVLDAAIGHFRSGLLTLMNAVLLLGISLTSEGQRFRGLSCFNRGIGRFVALAEK